MGYSFQLAARVLLYAPSHRWDSTCHSLCYTSRGVLGIRAGVSLSIHSFHLVGTRKQLNGSTMKDRSDDPTFFTTELHLAPSNSHSAIVASLNETKFKYIYFFIFFLDLHKQ